MDIITEGKAKFYASIAENGKISKELDVFYNPVMKFNRDVSVLLLNSMNELYDFKEIQIADIMAGSGVRALRFLKELNKGIIKNMTVNDYDENFSELFKKNLELNDMALDDSLIIGNKDANILLLESLGFDYIDIDPFGSPNPFLESSIVRISRNGILAVTATDTAPLSGTYPDACKRKYWAIPLRNYLMHEVGLRILIRKVQLIGSQHDKALVPIYSYFKDHYFRIFFKCTKGKNIVDEILAQHKYLLFCEKCFSHVISETNTGHCMKCDTKMIYSGPMWIGKIFDEKLAAKIFEMNNDKRNNKFLETIRDESLIDFTCFYDIHAIAKKFKLEISRFDKLIDSIKKDGYVVSRTHFTPLGIKTNMPLDELKLLMEKSGS